MFIGGSFRALRIRDPAGGLFHGAEEAGIIEAAVDPAPLPCQLRGEDRYMRDGPEIFADRPQVLLRRHPADSIKAAQVERPGVGAQRLLSSWVVVMLVEGHNQFPQSPVYRLTESKSGIVRFSNRPPVTLLIED